MTHWRPSLTARIGARLLGLALLWSLRPEGAWLHRLVRASPSTTPAQFLLAVLCVLSASAGTALLLMGPGLWKPAPVARRWQHHGLPSGG
ncbi:hypothetical protein Q4610_04225 [Sphingobium sp. HBC34]|uniref:Uncharacterized protein n=1 Tax=Sphingobium cyanobacteriorum TaxID=3063954 RepID=A0ABT8ZJ56_9SPHN|nr:hypothetical protein [Sphingobium sp. HBC34]MDO7834246.1 hypothetical protein [Sphingobium sp. HBC34]